MADHRTFGAQQLYLAARKETGDRRSPGRPSTVNNRGEFAAVVSETRTLKTLQEFSSVHPAVQIDFNQVAVSSLAKRAGVWLRARPRRLNTLGIGTVYWNERLGCLGSPRWVATSLSW